MENYIVSICWLLESKTDLIKVVANSDLDAFKKAMLKLMKTESERQEEINWQSSARYPEDLSGVKEKYDDFLVIEVALENEITKNEIETPQEVIQSFELIMERILALEKQVKDLTEPDVKVMLLEGAIMLKRQTDGAVGFDLHSLDDLMIPAFELRKIPTGICLELPYGWQASVLVRSSFASKGIIVQTGTIDFDYRGQIWVVLNNNTHEDFIIKKGDRVAQCVFTRVGLPTLVKVNELTQTVRGDGGFGSTNKTNDNGQS